MSSKGSSLLERGGAAAAEALLEGRDPRLLLPKLRLRLLELRVLVREAALERRELRGLALHLGLEAAVGAERLLELRGLALEHLTHVLVRAASVRNRSRGAGEMPVGGDGRVRYASRILAVCGGWRGVGFRLAAH